MDVRFRSRHDITRPDLEEKSKCDGVHPIPARAIGTLGNRRCPVVLLTILILAPASSTMLFSQLEVNSHSERIKAIADLSSTYAVTRDQARERLRCGGLEAFDSMLAALPSASSEQRLSLEQLLLELDGCWFRLLRDEAACELLKDFQHLSHSERLARIKLAGIFTAKVNLADLVWICRFELDESISRVTAAVLLERLNTLDDASREQMCRQIMANCQDSSRAACLWLKTIASTVPIASPDLSRLVEVETDRLIQADANVSQSTFSLLIAVIRLREYHSQRSGSSHLQSHEPVTTNSSTADTQRLETSRQNPNIEILSAVAERLLVEKCPIQRLPEFMDTLLILHRMQSAESVLEKHSQLFGSNPQLAIRAAQYYLLLGYSDKADDVILGIRERLERAATGQIEVAVIALQLGYNAIAERLLSQLIANSDLEQDRQTQARLILAELLGQEQRSAEAADCLEPLVQANNRESGVEPPPKQNTARDRLNGRWCYYRSEMERARGDSIAQNYWLVRGLQADPRSSDLLIAALRANPRQSPVRQVATNLIEVRCEELAIEIERLSERVESTPERDEAYRARRQLTTQLNRLAWLMCCTRQSPRRAIELANRAVSLDPDNPNVHDTLARCHFSAGDIPSAILSARSAHRLAPWNSTYTSNLKFYQSVPSTALLASRDDVLVEVR